MGLKPGDIVVLVLDGQTITLSVVSVDPIRRRRQHEEPAPPDVTFKVGSRHAKVGDLVRVLPSAKGKRDGYVATLKSVKLSPEGTLLEATVVPARGMNSKELKGSMSGERTYRAERLAGMNQIHNVT